MKKSFQKSQDSTKATKYVAEIPREIATYKITCKNVSFERWMRIFLYCTRWDVILRCCIEPKGCSWISFTRSWGVLYKFLRSISMLYSSWNCKHTKRFGFTERCFTIKLLVVHPSCLVSILSFWGLHPRLFLSSHPIITVWYNIPKLKTKHPFSPNLRYSHAQHSYLTHVQSP